MRWVVQFEYVLLLSFVRSQHFVSTQLHKNLKI